MLSACIKSGVCPRSDAGWLGPHQRVACGDVDGNGHSDVVVTNAEGSVYIFLNSGSGDGAGRVALTFDVGRSTIEGLSQG